MGFFKHIASFYFETNKEGDTIFYPWDALGVRGNGYIVPENRKASYQAALNIHTLIPFLLTFSIYMYECIVLLPVLGLYLCAYAIWIRRLTKNVKMTTEKMTLADSVVKSRFVCSLLFVIYGLYIIVSSPER